MPHVIVRLWPGKTDAQKAKLSDAIVSDMTRILKYGDDSVSVAIEEIAPEAWNEHVYKPDILDKWNTLSKEPGYGPRPQRPSDQAT